MDGELFCDGGVIAVNPSPHGGTWAWVLVERDFPTAKGSGVVLPEHYGLPKVTNNLTELVAAVQALDTVGPKWDGVLWTDSKVTLHRLTDGQGFAGIPQALRLQVLALRRQRKWSVRLVGGHPTKAELACGSKANGTPTSVWNQWCDHRCRQLAERFLNEREGL